VFWRVGSWATLGRRRAFARKTLAQVGITLTTGAAITGRALARTGAVTLDGNSVTATCTAGAPPAVCPVITLSPATLPNGTVAVAYSQTILGSGGTAPYTFSLTAGTLPAGLTLTTAGVLAGTPTTAASSTFTIRGTDANGCFASITYTVVIAPAVVPPAVCPVISMLPATAPNGTVAVAYSQVFTASGGTAPYTYGVTVGALPTGLTLTTGGTLAGTPTAAGTYTFTIRATDANGCFTSIPYTVVIAPAVVPPAVCPVISLLPATTPNAALGVAYSQAITASGGTAPYVYGITTVALPPSLTPTAAGLPRGPPTVACPPTFTLRATDANGCFIERAFTMIVATSVPTMPETFMILLTLGLMGIGYQRLRSRVRA